MQYSIIIMNSSLPFCSTLEETFDLFVSLTHTHAYPIKPGLYPIKPGLYSWFILLRKVPYVGYTALSVAGEPA